MFPSDKHLRTIASYLGRRYKNSADYRRFRHQDRHVANSSLMLGMVASIADKLTGMKQERDAVTNGTGRDLVVLKASVVDAELEKLDVKLRTVQRATRMVSVVWLRPSLKGYLHPATRAEPSSAVPLLCLPVRSNITTATAK
jgi:hypothetical protein